MQKIIGKMARMYPLLVAMGFMMIVISFVIGWVNSQAAAAYFAQPKVLRETTLMAQRAGIASTDLWLPYFKFFGIGILLGGIVMALRVILDNLKGAGLAVMANLPPEQRTEMPDPPWYGKLMPMVMMVGELIFIFALVVSWQLARMARQLFANPMPTIDAAGAGTPLLAQMQTIHSVSSWLVPLKFLGVATEYLAIVMGLATLVYMLSRQTEILDESLVVARSLLKADHTPVPTPIPVTVDANLVHRAREKVLS